MKLISRREHVTKISYVRSFWYEDHPGSWGFTFDCDENGIVALRKNTLAESNYAACLMGDVQGHKVYNGGIEKREHNYSIPAVGLCDCGRELYLKSFTNTCDCGRDYNSSGQLLAPREQWGEETGESLSDILRIS